MLHIFHLDGGRAVLFDARYATGTVAKLKEAIHCTLSVLSGDQILLISGGEVLDSARKVASYGTGFDSSNPIFLICKSDLGSTSSHIKYLEPFNDPQISQDNEAALSRQQKAASSGSISYQTVQYNAQLAKKFTTTADECSDSCRRLVDDQHLMHQGWRAVTANLDDTWLSFNRRAARFGERREKLNQQKSRVRELLENFGADLSLLKRIPVLSCLLDGSHGKVPCSVEPTTCKKSCSEVSLYDWIASKEPESSLQALANEVKLAINEILDEKVLDSLAKLELSANERVGDSSMKEIKGLGQRLEQLNKGLEMLKAKQAEQKELAEKIMAKEVETLNIRDTSKFSEVCSMQLENLQTLLQNNQRLVDITKRFFDAKSELLKNVRVRLRWVFDTHRIIQAADHKVLLSNERLRKVCRQLELIRQVHDAPVVYAAATAEILRRRLFGAEFIEWAKNLVEKSRNLHQEEIQLRQIFAHKIDRHFLRSLFPGIEDNFPAFCLEIPKVFDDKLPSVEIQNIREIRSSVPVLVPYLQVQKAQIFQRLLVQDPQSSDLTDSASLSRAPSFLVQARTSPFKSLALNQRQPSVSSLNSLGATCQSPSWTSGDDYSPSPFSNLLAAGHYPPASELHNFETSDATSLPKIRPQELQYSDSCSSVPRSAPMAIPSHSHSMSSSHVSNPSSCLFGTPTENLHFSVDTVADSKIFPLESMDQKVLPDSSFLRRKSGKNFSSASLYNLTPLGEEPVELLANKQISEESNVEGQFNAVKYQLEAALQRECHLKAALSEAKKKIGRRNRMDEFEANLKPFLAYYKAWVHQIRNDLAEFIQATKDSANFSSKVLFDAAKKLELNLQKNLAEARNASETLQKAEFLPILDEMREELGKEKQSHWECTKRLENCQAYLAQKDDVIELLQQQLDNNEKKLAEKSVEMSNEITDRLLIEHEIDLDKLRSDYRAELDQKHAQNQFLLQELNDKNQMMKQMKKEHDKLVSSMYERTSRCLNIESCEFDQSKSVDEDLLIRLKSLKIKLESSYAEKLCQATAALSDQHRLEIDDLKLGYELELQALKAKLFSADSGQLFDDVTKGSSSPFFHRKNSEQLAEDMALSSNYCTILQHECLSPDGENFYQKSGNGVSTALKLHAGRANETPTSDPDLHDDQSAGDLPGPSLRSYCRFTQTKPVCQQVSVLRVHKGDLVLLVFDTKTDAFVVFTVSPVLYIVKESSVQRMALQKPSTLTDPKGKSVTNPSSDYCVLARLLDMDFCQIKKDTNRYNLSMNTKFYRVSAQKCDVATVVEAK